MPANDVVILSGCRTAIGTFGGALKDVPATELGALVVREAVTRAAIRPDQVDEVILGCILQAGLGHEPGAAGRDQGRACRSRSPPTP